MKKAVVLCGLFLSFLLILFNGTQTGLRSSTAGAPAGRTGSPRDGVSCISCHSPTTNFTGAGSITSNIPPEGYTPGQVYSITASIARMGRSKFGFQVSPQDTTPAGNYAGILSVTNATATQLVNTNYITHRTDGTSGLNGRSWSFNWTAPATGKGPVVFYGAFMATNSSNSDSGDSIFLATLKVYEYICPLPAAPGAISGLATVCTGSVQTYTVPDVAGATSYVWTLPNGWSGSSVTNSITTTVGQTGGSISVRAVNSCGSSAASSQPVTVNVVNPVSVSISASDTVICNGALVSFSAEVVNGGNNPVYQWKVNGVNVGSNSPGYSNAGLSNLDVVSVEVTSNALCASPALASSNLITMDVAPLGTPSVGITSNSGLTICENQKVRFTAQPVFGGQAPVYQWQKNGMDIFGETGTFYSDSLIADGDIISVRMASSERCVTPLEVVSGVLVMNVVQNGVPTVTIASNSGDSICKGETVTFTAQTEVSGNTPQYQWRKNGEVIDVATSETYTTDVLSDRDEITVMMISTAACAVTDSAYSLPLPMTVLPLPLANVTFANDTLTSSEGVSYQWYLNEQPVAGARNQTLRPSQSGAYKVIISDGYGCSNTSTVLDIIVTNIAESISPDFITIYPNPAVEGSLLTIQSSMVNAMMEVYDNDGKLVFHSVISTANSAFELQVPKGVYFIRIHNESMSVVKRWIKF